MWPSKMKFDWPCSEIGWKMANGQLLYCALIMIQKPDIDNIKLWVAMYNIAFAGTTPQLEHHLHHALILKPTCIRVTNVDRGGSRILGKGGSEYRGGSLKQLGGLGGAAPRSYRMFPFYSTEIMPKCKI